MSRRHVDYQVSNSAFGHGSSLASSKDGVELAELLIVEPGVVDSVIVYLVCQSHTLRLRRESLTEILDRPRLVGAPLARATAQLLRDRPG